MNYQVKLKNYFQKEQEGIPYKKLIQMEDEEIEAYIEQKTGKKITWPKGAKVEGLPIITMEDIDKKIDEWER